MKPNDRSMNTQRHLLIVGGESDPNTRRVVDQAHLRGRSYTFWDTDRDDCHRIAWDFDNPQIDLGDTSCRPTSLFLRFNVFGGQAETNHHVFSAIQAYGLAWPHVRILNRAVMTDANNKSRNLRIAKTIGFKIPDTTVLSDLTPLATIPNPDRRIIKPLDGGAHTVGVETIHDDIERLSGLGPQFVQSRLDGENIRVFSIGGKLFAFHLQTNHLDYREDETVEVVQINVPDDLVDQIHRLARETQFDYCALDFRCADGWNDPVFLEINSFPMFVRFDDAAENALADAVLDFLLEHQPVPPS